MRNVIFFILALGLFSCGISNERPLIGFDAVLMNSDSTSVLTSKEDKVVINYKDGDMMRQLYDVSVENNGEYYTFSSVSALGIKDNPLYIDYNGKVDTLIITQSSFYADEPFEGTFNGKRIYLEKYQGLMYLVR